MNHPLRCRCGTIQGHVRLPVTSGRALCYCKDCRAYARLLEERSGARIADAAGGSDIVALPPSHVRLERGLGSLACVSLSPRGILRWYAGCCDTPIANTPRDPKVHYAGLLHNCLDSQPIEPSFGPVTVRINTDSATAPVKGTPLASVLAIAKLMSAMLPARFNGRYRDNPFFDAEGRPAVEPQVLDLAERARLTQLG
jgi:hypothetical protein